LKLVDDRNMVTTDEERIYGEKLSIVNIRDHWRHSVKA